MRHFIVAGLIVITCLLSSTPASSYGYPGGWNGTWSLWHAETPMVGQTVWKHFGDIRISESLVDYSEYGIAWNIQGNNIRWSVDRIPSYENNGYILAKAETIQSGNMAGTNAKFSANWYDEVPGGSYWDSFKPTNIQCSEDNKGIIEIKKEVPNYADLMNEMLKIRTKDPESGAFRPYGPEDFFSARIRMCQDQHYEDIWGFRFDRNSIGGGKNPEEETDSSGSLVLSTNQGETEVKAGDTIKLSPEERIKLTAKCDKLIELVAANIGKDRNIDTSLFTIAEYFWVGKNITSGHLPSVQVGSFLNVKKAFYSCIKLLYGKNGQSLSKQFISQDPSELPAQIELNLERGPFVAEVVNDQVLLGIDTATMTATSIGKNTFGVVYDPTSGIGFVIAYDNPVNIKPKNSNLAPFTIGAGQMVGISMDKVSPIIPISPTQGGSEPVGQQGSTYVSPDGKDIYGPTESTPTGSTVYTGGTSTPIQGPEGKNYLKGQLLAGPISLPARQNTPTDILYLDSGRPYVVMGEGVCSLWSDHTDGVDSCFCYAQWRCPDKPQAWGQLELTNPSVHMSDLIEKDAEGNPVYNPSHIYEAIITGEGKTLQAQVSEGGGFDDNNGELRISIYEAIPVQGGEVPSGIGGSTYVSPDGKDIYGQTSSGPSTSSAVQILDHTMASQVDEKASQPITRANTFNLGTGTAYSWLKLGTIDDAHQVEWKWFSPDGELYESYANQIPKPSGMPWEWYSVYSSIPISGHSAVQKPGNWHVDVFIDGQKALTEQFTLLAQNGQQPSGLGTGSMQGGCHFDPSIGQTICVDNINDFSNPDENVQGGCRTDPITGEITCVDTIGSLGQGLDQENSQGQSLGGCYQDPRTGEIICIDMSGEPEDLTAPETGCFTDPSTGEVTCIG